MAPRTKKKTAPVKGEKGKPSKPAKPGQKKAPVKGKKGKPSKPAKIIPNFPVKQVHKLLEKESPNVDPRAAVYLTGVLEYVAAEILELSGNVSKGIEKEPVIDEAVIKTALDNDEELSMLQGRVRGDE